MGLKEIQLAPEVYPEIGLRPMGDIDILIHREDYDRVLACMIELGFSPLPDPDIPFTLKYAWAHHFCRKSDNVWVDLQWNVLQIEWDVCNEGNFDFDIARMWRGARTMSIGTQDILVPKPEDMLFHLCMHLEGHYYAELILFCDIVELVDHYGDQLDWRYLIDIVKQYRVESSVYYALFWAHRLFGLALPQFVLQALDPVYFQGNLLQPIFGNLTILHVSMDEIRLAAFPPAAVLSKFEFVVRQQAVSAMHLYREIDGLARAFSNAGGKHIIVNGAPSERVFPDPSLQPFQPVRFLILDRDLACMRQALSDRGFSTAGDQTDGTLYKESSILSQDPALHSLPIHMVIHSESEVGVDGLLQLAEQDPIPRKDIAIQLIGSRLAGRCTDATQVVVRFQIVVLTPEEMVLYLGTRLGQHKQNRLFGLNSLIEFFERQTDPLDWSEIIQKAEQTGTAALLAEAMQLADQVLDGERFDAMSHLATPRVAPRVLEWARYGPDAFGPYAGLKSSFLFLLSFLAMDGFKARLGYLWRSLFGTPGRRAMLPGLVREALSGFFALWRPMRQPSIAYWAEPEALESDL